MLNESPLPPTEAVKLIKFYLNLYPDLVGTLKEYFPKQASSEFNRTIKVAIPKDVKSQLSVILVKEFAYVKWYWEGNYLMVPYHNNSEWVNLTKDIRKFARTLGVKNLSFKGIKGMTTAKSKQTKKSIKFEKEAEEKFNKAA